MDHKVIFTNTDLFVNGSYEVTELHDGEDGTVVLDSNHKKTIGDDE